MMTQYLCDAAKAVLKGKLQKQSPTSRKKKTLNRQSNLIPKALGKTRKKISKLTEGKKS